MELPKRIAAGSDVGTIKYCGPVPEKNGTYYGIEWDVQSRGKHSGLGLFSTRLPDSATFLNISRCLDYGQGFIEAIKVKYIGETPLAPVYLGSSKGVKVETVGWEKMQEKLSKLGSMKVVGLSGMRVSRGEPKLIKDTCGEIEDIDLSRNLLATFEQVAVICQQLNALQILRLNFNRLSLSTTSDLSSAFKHVKILTLASTLLTWDDVLTLDRSFKSLKELYIDDNQITNLSGLKPNQFEHLDTLSLEGNGISDWVQIENLSYLPNLTTINLSRNKLGNIEDSNGFKALTSLNLKNNLLSSWTDIHRLNQFGKLDSIRVAGNPISDSIPRDHRLLILTARISKVKRLDGSQVLEADRRNAECYYLSQAHLDVEGPLFFTLHPRYKELCLLHGTPNSKKEERTIAEGILLLYFESSAGRIEKKVSKRMSLRVFRTVLARSLFPLKWTLAVRKDIIVTHLDGHVVDFEQSDDTRSLDYLKVTAGSIFSLAM